MIKIFLNFEDNFLRVNICIRKISELMYILKDSFCLYFCNNK